MKFRNKTHLLSSVTVAISVATVVTTSAATWDGPNNGDYATAVNWNPDVVPVSGDSTIAGGNTAIYSTAGNITSTGRMLIGSTGANSGTLTMQGSAGTLSFAGSPFNNANYIGVDGSTGTVNVNAGTLAVTGMTNGAGHLHIGANGSVSNGALNIGGGTVNVGTRVTMGVGYPGDLINTVGNNGNGNATITISSGSLNIGSSTVTDTDKGGLYMKSPTGGSGTATVNLNGGTLNLTRFIIGAGGTSKTININGGTIQANASNTTFLPTGSTNNVTNAGGIIDTQAFNITMAGALTNAAGSTTGIITKIGAGTLTLSGANTYTGATAIKNGTLALGGGDNRLPTGTTVTLGDGLTNTNGILRLDSRSQQLAGLVTAGIGTGNRVTNGSATAATLTLNVASGTNTFGGILGGGAANENNFALTKSGNGTLALTGANTYTGLTTVNGGTLVFSGSGTISTASAITVQSGGTLRFSRNDTWGIHTTGATAAITIDAGGVVESNNSFNALINLTLNGGTLSANDGVNATFPTFGIKGTVTANATAGGSTISTTGTGDHNTISIGTGVGGGITTFAVADGAAASDLTVSVPLSNLAGVLSGLTKTGAGTMTLSATNTYTGATAVNVGTLLINGSISTSSLTTVAANATLGGSGTVGPLTVQDNGTLSPGTSPGTLNSGTVSLANLSNLNFELKPGDFTIGGGINDLVSVTGNLTLDGILNLTPTSGNFLSAIEGNAWRLFNYSGGTLTNNTLDFGSMPSLGSGLGWSIDTATSGQVNLVVVPEPSAALLGGLGLLALLRRRR